MVTFSPMTDRTPMTEFSMTAPRPITQPSQIRLLLDGCAADPRTGQVAGPREDRLLAEGEVERGHVERQIDVGLVERPDTVPMSSQ